MVTVIYGYHFALIIRNSDCLGDIEPKAGKRFKHLYFIRENVLIALVLSKLTISWIGKCCFILLR